MERMCSMCYKIGISKILQINIVHNFPSFVWEYVCIYWFIHSLIHVFKQEKKNLFNHRNNDDLFLAMSTFESSYLKLKIDHTYWIEYSAQL